MSNRHATFQRRLIWPPEPGIFALRLVRGAWRAPCRIIYNDDGRWQAEIDGELQEPDADPALAHMVSAIWHGGIKVDAATYQWMLAVKAHAALHDPDHPALHPRKPIDPRRLKPLTF
jgi:hypothetical protein